MHRVIQERYTIGLNLYQGCNLSCNGCVSANERLREGGNLTLHKAKEQIDRVADAGFRYIVSASSELTLWEHFAHVVSYVTRRGLKMSVLTNGTTLSDKLLADMSCLSRLVVSIDKRHDEQIKKQKTNGVVLLEYPESLNLLYEKIEGLDQKYYNKKIKVNTTISASDIDEMVRYEENSFLCQLAKSLLKYKPIIKRWNLFPLNRSPDSPNIERYKHALEQLVNQFPNLNHLIEDRLSQGFDYVWYFVYVNGEVQMETFHENGVVTSKMIGNISSDFPNIIKMQRSGHLT